MSESKIFVILKSYNYIWVISVQKEYYSDEMNKKSNY